MKKNTKIILIGCLILAIGAAALLWRGRGVHLDEEFATQTYEGMTTDYLNSSNHSNVSILYLHDSRTDGEITDRQWRRLNQIANETDAEIIIPEISSLSDTTDEAVYASLYAWYVPWQYGNDSRIFYMMGDDDTDSGLVTGFTSYLEAQGAALPDGTTSMQDVTSISFD